MQFTPSAAANRVAEHSLRQAGRPGPDVISLASGDPDFATPDYIRQALVDAVNAGYTHYVDGQGDIDLRSALSASIAAKSGADVSARQIVMTHGANSALAAAIIATINPGERVLIPEPTYSLYADLVRMVGGIPVFIRHRADLHLDLAALAAEAPTAKMVIICHPCNPTGIVFRRDELEALADLAVAHDLLVLADEAYDHIVFEGVTFTSTLEIPRLQDRLIYCQTFSKTYAMTGWRLGYVCAPQPIAVTITQMHRTLNGPMNAAVQRAALAAVTTVSDWPERMRREYQARRELVFEYLAGIPGVEARAPDGSFYAFVRYDHQTPSAELAAYALANGVAIRPGREFGPGGEGAFRIAFAVSRERLQQGMVRLQGILGALPRK